MASIQDMIKEAADAAGTTSGTQETTETTEAPAGIQIERQNIEHVKGQAKSGLSA